MFDLSRWTCWEYLVSWNAPKVQHSVESLLFCNRANICLFQPYQVIPRKFCSMTRKIWSACCVYHYRRKSLNSNNILDGICFGILYLDIYCICMSVLCFFQRSPAKFVIPSPKVCLCKLGCCWGSICSYWHYYAVSLNVTTAWKRREVNALQTQSNMKCLHYLEVTAVFIVVLKLTPILSH